MSPNDFTLTPSAWDALDRLCDAYGMPPTAPATLRRKSSNKGVRA